ncbi:MAG: NapC/NirT family cytochrome c [Desulfuromonadaceae bacterium]|nr:NapC/NirT family cytochrome c [Desulfuromonadaceae bacterium]MDD2849554.1 NapC/NirT family cytochrome c [Desulfuromonadaceae bacterium]MDD4131980.1 NapC/NirT family cytochrome c [Desulfuromonadaceae bacterium]
MLQKKSLAYKYLMNPASIIGAVTVFIATMFIVIFLAIETFTGLENPYIGIFVYFIFPGMLICGLLLIPIGAWRVRNHCRKCPEAGIPPLPRIDLNDPGKLKLTIFFILASIGFMLIVGIAAIKGYEFTESTTFCGELCHVPMEPEFVAWKNSPHAKVKCVECHVGPGAQWYVKAKISGLRQLWVMANHSWPTPIQTPVENLRPARATCERCHWPEKFYAGRQKIFYHYADNKENTPAEIDMLLRIGGTPMTPNAMGIHWHIGREVRYIAADKKRLEIPYIAVKGSDGKIVEYMDPAKPLSKDDIANSEKRLMDCIDCHNKPTHIYHSPSEEMDQHFASNTIDRNIPFLKKVAIELLEKPYKSADEATVAIEAGIKNYYLKNYPDVFSKQGAALTRAISEINAIYKRNYFPRMNVSWSTYPNHIGHFHSPGCFRCHDGKHKSPEGRLISKDCNLCHTILGQTQGNIPKEKPINSFAHPVDIGDDLYKTNCSECHGAGNV